MTGTGQDIAEGFGLVVGSFIAMEGVSYAMHRWVMHRIGMRLHASHHRPPQPGWEANDLFPVFFSMIGIAVFALASTGPQITALWWVGAGVTLYGLCYLFVHEVYIHHRLPITIRQSRYLEWLRRSHRVHHLTGAEPYGMLMPVLSRRQRDRAERLDEVAQIDDDVLERLVSTREMRSRL